MFLKDSIILELLASWKYEKQPVMMTTAVSTIPRYNWREEKESELNIFTRSVIVAVGTGYRMCHFVEVLFTV